ncbi:MAG: hypothetical protein RLZZ15_2896 [Verrucomicrobiota bacterium]
MTEEADGGLMLLNPATEGYYRLDAASHAWWRALVVESRPLDTVVAEAVASFDADPALVRHDLAQFVAQLRRAGFVIDATGMSA